ncbi:MAG: T9SS C-terminal target domain-containing protein [Limnospira sp.]
MASAITFALGNLADRAVYVGFAGEGAIDIYTFNHPAAGRLNCSLEGFGAGLEVRLKNKDGRTLDRRTVSGNQSEAIGFDIPAGFYALEIASTGGSTTYQLTVEQDQNNIVTKNSDRNPKSNFYNYRNSEKQPPRFSRSRSQFAPARCRDCDRQLNDILWGKKQQILGFCSPHSLSNCPPPIQSRELISPQPRGHPD